VTTFPGLPPLAPEDQPPDAPDQQGDDTVNPPSDPNSPQWGLYKDGEAVIVADSVTAVHLRPTSQISDYPVEEGGFQSYDKVQLPLTGVFRFTTGGSVSDRADMLDSIEDAKQSLDLYDFVMPEKTYPNVNVTDYDLSRANTDSGLLSVDVSVEEVRSTVVAAFSKSAAPNSKSITNAKTPTANDSQSGGTVAPGLTTATQDTALANTYFPGPPDPSPLGQPYVAGH